MIIDKKQNIPEFLNGEEIIKIVNARKDGFLTGGNASTFQGMLDRNEYLFREKEDRYHLGLLEAWGMQTVEHSSMIGKLLNRGSEILVNGFFGEFTYDKPFFEPKKQLRTTKSTADDAGDFPGMEETEFPIVLSEKVYYGEILGTDLYDGQSAQLIVVEDAVAEGDGWRAKVTLTSGQSADYYNKALLEKDINYYRINHTVVEYDTKFRGVSDFNVNPTGYVQARFKLGGVRGVEGTVTGFADIMNQAKENKVPMVQNDGSLDNAMRKFQNKYANGDSEATTVIFGNKDYIKNTQDLSKLRATSLMELLVEKTLMQITDTSHMWQKRGVVRSKNGANAYLNEGVYYQMKRGKVITIPKYMGITKAHINEAVNYLFKGNDMPWDQREVVFEVGTLAEQNLLLLFQDEINQQLLTFVNNPLYKIMLGDRGLLNPDLAKNIITGSDLNNLEFKNLIRFKAVTLLGIAGRVTFKVNKALDYMYGDSNYGASAFQNGKSWTSHSMFIWDVTDSQYSNNMKGINGATNKEGGDVKVKDNLYLIRPKQGMTFKGHANGRWDKGKTSEIISSHSFIGQEFWAFNSSAEWVPYPERCIIIELAPGARRRGFTPYAYA